MLLPTFVSTRLDQLYKADVICHQLSRMSQPAYGKHNAEQLRTVGWPAYLAQHCPAGYVRAAAQQNERQWKCFQPLYEDVLSTLRYFFNEKICFSARAAIPGFHVIRINEDHPVYHGGVPHVDSSYLNVPMFSAVTSPVEQYSFTMLLSQSGPDVGLDHWSPDMSESGAVNSQPEAFVPYRCGELMIFSSQLVHRIAPFSSIQERVTLQGHLIRFNAQLLAYW